MIFYMVLSYKAEDLCVCGFFFSLNASLTVACFSKFLCLVLAVLSSFYMLDTSIFPVTCVASVFL